MKKISSILIAFIFALSVFNFNSASAAEPGRKDLRKLLDQAHENQFKLADEELYGKSIVQKTLSPNFTNGFIDRFVKERMTEVKTKRGTRYTIPPSDWGHLILWGDSFSWTKDTKVSYSRKKNIATIKISEYYGDEDGLYGPHTYEVILRRDINGKLPYKIHDIRYIWDEEDF